MNVRRNKDFKLEGMLKWVGLCYFILFSTFVRYAEIGFLYGVQLNHKTIILFETNCSSKGLSLKAISPLFTQFEQGTNMTSEDAQSQLFQMS